MLCPDNILIIGGGRWARVITETLCRLVPSRVRVYIYSYHNIKLMTEWASGKHFEVEVQVSSDMNYFPSDSIAVIVANAVRDHEKAVEWAIHAGLPVMVEKPITLSYRASYRLYHLACSQKNLLVASHVFFITKFSSLITQNHIIQSIRMTWVDAQYEVRYGEKKEYDSSIPIFVDCLPHILSIISTLTDKLPERCEELKFYKGGSHLELKFMCGEVPCEVLVMRNGEKRERNIEVMSSGKKLFLNFTEESGIIFSGFDKLHTDLIPKFQDSPLAQMLKMFLQAAAGGNIDARLSFNIGLHVNQIIDQTLSMYKKKMSEWLVKSFELPMQNDGDLRYAVTEILQYNTRLPNILLKEQIERVCERIYGADNKQLFKMLDSDNNPTMILKTVLDS